MLQLIKSTKIAVAPPTPLVDIYHTKVEGD